jgi:glutamate synthase (NADPH/NADH) large chain
MDHQGGDLENHGLVDISRDMTRYDAKRLKCLIEKHLHYTNSAVARRILDDWEGYLPKFVKVMPVDYKRALAEMQANQSRPPRPGKQLPNRVNKGIADHG